MAFGLLEGEPVFPTNRAAVEALTRPVGWVERLRDRVFPQVARVEQHGPTDSRAEASGPPTEPNQITRSTN